MVHQLGGFLPPKIVKRITLRMLRLYELADLLEKVVPWVHPKSSDGCGSANWANPWDRKMQMKLTGETYPPGN